MLATGTEIADAMDRWQKVKSRRFWHFILGLMAVVFGWLSLMEITGWSAFKSMKFICILGILNWGGHLIYGEGK